MIENKKYPASPIQQQIIAERKRGHQLPPILFTGEWVPLGPAASGQVHQPKVGRNGTSVIEPDGLEQIGGHDVPDAVDHHVRRVAAKARGTDCSWSEKQSRRSAKVSGNRKSSAPIRRPGWFAAADDL